LTLRFRTSGTDNSSSSYGFSRSGSGDGVNSLIVGSFGATNLNIAYGWDTSSSHSWELNVYRPAETAVTNATWLGHSAKADFGGFGNTSGYGSFTGTTSFDSLSFISSAASNMTGTYRVYGMAD
jgi:hypothetical protein